LSADRISYKGLNKKRMILVAALSIIGIFSLLVFIPEVDINSMFTAISTTNTESINSVYTSAGKEEERSIVPQNR